MVESDRYAVIERLVGVWRLLGDILSEQMQGFPLYLGMDIVGGGIWKVTLGLVLDMNKDV